MLNNYTFLSIGIIDPIILISLKLLLGLAIIY